MNKRKFEIIRKPDLVGSSFLFNNVRVAYVGTNPENNISFYANNGQGGVIGVSVYPDGRKVLKNATLVSKGYAYTHSKADYLQFKHAFGHGKHILASHAVYIAWRNKEIPAGMTIDHIDGNTFNNDIRNLRAVPPSINSRDGGFMRKLRHNGFIVTMFPGIILDGYKRMAEWKAEHTYWQYRCLKGKELLQVFVGPHFRIEDIDTIMSREMSHHCERRLV